MASLMCTMILVPNAHKRARGVRTSLHKCWLGHNENCRIQESNSDHWIYSTYFIQFSRQLHSATSEWTNTTVTVQNVIQLTTSTHQYPQWHSFTNTFWWIWGSTSESLLPSFSVWFWSIPQIQSVILTCFRQIFCNGLVFESATCFAFLLCYLKIILIPTSGC